MPTRNRQQSAGGPEGLSEYYASNTALDRGDPPLSVARRSYVASQQNMQDTVGQRHIDNPAASTAYRRKPCTANGVRRPLIGLSQPVKYIDWPFACYSETVNHISIPRPVDSALVTEGAALANPANVGKHGVALPVSLIELRELPRMFKNFLEVTWKRAAGSYVEYSFGYAPIISDLQNLFRLPETIEKRIAELNYLRSKEKVSRTRTVWSGSAKQTLARRQVFSSPGLTIWSTPEISTESDAQVTSRWRPRDEIKSLSDPEMAVLARNLVLGLTPESLLAHAWELLPWSWLIDWFSNLGDFLALTNNSVAYLSGPCCLTVKTTSTYKPNLELVYNSTSQYWSYPSFKTNGFIQRVDWNRGIPLFLPTLSGSFLTSHQTSILASIASSRMLR